MKRLKRVASRLPGWAQQELKRLHFARQIRRGDFATREPEYARLREWVGPGDWVLDVGANVGRYALGLSRLVGPEGRVLAFEPVPESFELLTANVARSPWANVTLVNAAVSDRSSAAHMEIPNFATGLRNFYCAQIDGEGTGLHVLTLAIDSLALPHRVSFVKIDVEGHEARALRGMHSLLRRDRPVLVVEGFSREVQSMLEELGYCYTETPGSPNRVFEPAGDATSTERPAWREAAAGGDSITRPGSGNASGRGAPAR